MSFSALEELLFYSLIPASEISILCPSVWVYLDLCRNQTEKSEDILLSYNLCYSDKIVSEWLGPPRQGGLSICSLVPGSRIPPKVCQEHTFGVLSANGA